ncbi:hypothetical protein [Megalodesulfovibrio paquesii]
MDTTLSLETPPDAAYTRVLTTAAETLARAQGLAPREQLRFQLTVEELFTYLARTVPDHGPIRTVLTGRPYQVCASIRFRANGLCLGALNAGTPALGAKVAGLAADEGEGGDAGEPLNLILAGRAADRFRMDTEGGDAFILHAEVDKVYPACRPEASSPRRIVLAPPYHASLETDSSRLMQAAALAACRYAAWHCPASFQTPGKVADLHRAGQLCAVLARDKAGRPAGLLSWTCSGERGLSFSGPFVFAPPGDGPAVARLLVEAFLAAVARQDVHIVFSERATPDAPERYFESLGTLAHHGQDGCCEQPVLYRHLREDTGDTVWAAPELTVFLRQAYDRLAMCRDILPAHPPAGYERQRSLFSTVLDKGKGLAVLRPLLDGADAADILAAQAGLLSARRIPNILLYLDLSRAWEAALAAPALRAGFQPRLVLPCAGRSDVLVLQHAQSH